MSEKQIKAPIDRFSRASHIYKQLISIGVTPNDIDVGCHFIDYAKPGPNSQIRYAGNYQIEACEVLEFALDHDDVEYPDKKKHPEIAQEVADGPLPWLLDDYDPKTQFDATIRAHVEKAIEFLRSQPALKKLEAQPVLHDELLATALFYFAMLPSKQQLKGVDPVAADEEMLRLMSELKSKHLEVFQKWILQNGGLGILSMKAGFSQGLSAIGGIRENKKMWLTPAYMLFAVFREAGLSPHFVYAPWRAIRSGIQSRMSSLPNWELLGDTAQGTVIIGLDTRQGLRLFDPSFFNSAVTLDDYYPMHRLHFLALHNTMEILEDSSNTASLGEVRHWDPYTPVIPFMSAVVAADQKDYGLALLFFKETVRKDPQTVGFYLKMADVLFLMGDATSGIQAIENAIERDPGDGRAHFALANAYRLLGSEEKAIRNYRRATQLDNLNSFIPLGLIDMLLQTDRAAEAEVVINDAYVNYSTHENFITGLAARLMAAKNYEKAEWVLTNAIDRNVVTRDIYRMLVEVFLLEGETENARKQLSLLKKRFPVTTEHKYAYAIQEALSHSKEPTILKSYAAFLMGQPVDYPNAIRILDAGRTRYPDDFDIHLMLARAYDRSDQVEELGSLLRDMLIRFAEHPEIEKARKTLDRLD